MHYLSEINAKRASESYEMEGSQGTAADFYNGVLWTKSRLYNLYLQSIEEKRIPKKVSLDDFMLNVLKNIFG